MPTAATTFIRQLRRIIVAQCPSQLADDELLSQFISERDETAFALLVRRHGSMVLGVCGNVLRHQQDAEDVFQATFLLLARKADTIRKHQSLSSWLHGVAYRLALKMRTQNSRRHAREQAVLPPQRSEFGDDLSVRESRVLLHEEMNRLPEKYRAVLLLCYWEGKTREEAAARLGMTPDALKKRLERARNLLGSRLTRRGLAPTVALFTWLISENGARAAVSSLLIQNTAQAAVAFASAQSVAVGASTAAVTLAQGAIRTMFLIKFFTTLLTLLAVIGGGTTLGFVGYSALAGKQPDAERIVVLQAQPKPKAIAQPAKKTDAERIVGTWRYAKYVMNGKEMAADFYTLARTTITKDGMSMTLAFGPGGITKYKLVAPGKIDTTEPLGYGIYKFDGDDQLTMCLVMEKSPEKRPTEFSSEVGTNQDLHVLHRVKPGEEKLTEKELAKFRKSPEAIEAVQRDIVMNNLKQIALAMHNYDAAYKGFPTQAMYSKDGKTALLSWRVAILPFIGQHVLYGEFKLDEPWDSAHNKKLIAKMPKIYADVRADAKNDNKTYYQVFTGPGTAFAGSKKKTPAEFTAGTSNTALAAEAKDAVIWTQPIDIVVPAEKGNMPALGGLFPSGFHVIMADGSVRFVPRDTTPAILRTLVIPKE